MKQISLLILFILLICCKEVVVENPQEAPQGFAELDTTDWFSAISPEGMIYRIRLIKNIPEQSLEFWAEALTNHLQNEGYAAITTGNEFYTDESFGLYSEWNVPYNKDTYKYLSGILVSEKSIAVIEAAADHVIYNLHREALLKNLKTIEINDTVAIEITRQDVLSGNANVVRTINANAVRSITATAQNEARSLSSSSGCFLPDTLILTEDGKTPIASVWPGTSVPSFDPVSGIWSRQKVKRNVSLSYSGDIITIGIGGEEIEVTGNHPFLVSDGKDLEFRLLPDELPPSESVSPVSGRWVEARDLQKGDNLLSLDRNSLGIDYISTRIETRQVSFLAITGPHTYAVEGPGLIVHNAGEQEEVKGELFESYREVNEHEIATPAAVAVRLPTETQNERIRVYSGACNLRLDNVEQAKRDIALLADNAGGFVEHSSDQGIVIRLPAVSFRIVFDQILELGEILHKAIETYDVTDQYSDPEGRLIVAIKARDRLYTLLKRVEDVKERLEILKKIRTYSETIEKLELSFQVLEQRVAMSRITVDLTSRLEEKVTTVKSIPFQWIDRLRPHSVSTKSLGDNISVTLPDDIAVFQNVGVLRAEAANGTRIRIGSEKNNPRGDSLFWQQALLFHLKYRYKNAEEITKDSIKLVLFSSKDKNPFYYLVGAIPLEREPSLIVFEVYFPNQEALERHLSDLIESFQQVKIL